MQDEWVRETPGGVSVLVRVIPRAGSTKTAGLRDGRLLVRLAAAPVDGAANEALIALFAKLLKIPSGRIRVTSGERSRNKQLTIGGVGPAQILAVASSI